MIEDIWLVIITIRQAIMIGQFSLLLWKNAYVSKFCIINVILMAMEEDR